MEFQEERGIGYCGLACVLCGYDDGCPGCKKRIAVGHDCPAGKCVADIAAAGCYSCQEYDTCDEGMPHGKRSRVFNRYAREFGEQALIDRLRVNFEAGITYHTPDKSPGDYDKLETEDEIYQLLRYGRNDPYVKCPVYEDEHFLLRLVEMVDAESLLPCYSQPTDSVTANSFNCTYGYGAQTLDAMLNFIRRWLEAYRERGFVRWSVVDKSSGAAVGAIELFNSNNTGVLRLDLCGDYENTKSIEEILSLLLTEAFMLFGCTKMTTKVAPTAKERMVALSKMGFHPSEEKIVRGDGVSYDGFWILERQNHSQSASLITL